jgi:hypothetical protein
MNRSPMLATRRAIAAVTVSMLVTSAAGAAHAQTEPPRDDRHLGLMLGATIAGAVLGAAIDVQLDTPRLSFELHAGAAPPPPPPEAWPVPPPEAWPAPPPEAWPAPPLEAWPAPPPCCYEAPPPAVVVAQPPAPPPKWRQLGFGVSGLVQTPGSGKSSTAGVAVSFHGRTSSRTQLAIELQSLAVDRSADQSRRSDVAGLVAGRLYLWNAALVPYLDLAGGLGRASFTTNELHVTAAQLIGRAGLGLELRLGRHLLLEGMLAEVERVRFDGGSGATAPDSAAGGATVIANREASTELRGGVAYRF